MNVLVRHYADETRITILALLPVDDTDKEIKAANSEHFRRLQERVESVLTPNFASRLLARSLNLMGVIRDNADVFSEAAARHLGSRRLGDQIGALLAGGHTLRSTKPATLEEALAIVSGLDWSEYVPSGREGDEQSILSVLLEYMTRMTTTGGEQTIGELVFAAAGMGGDVPQEAAEGHLRRLGFRVNVDAQCLLISNTHSMIARILEKTPWPAGWSRHLKRLPGAVSTKNPQRFSPGTKHRAVKVPLSLIVDTER